MNIDNLKINGFGNLINKEIKLKNGINLIIGNNEMGKSTLLKFISSMLFGLTKKESDKINPWYSTEFSGKIDYTLDNNKKYSIFRNFSKNQSQVLNDELDDITSQYGKSKTRGTSAFYEQTKIDESLFSSTALINQGETRLKNDEEHELMQKITNLLSTGKDNISYKKTIDKLNKKLIVDIGTDRTTDRPINILNERIDKLKSERETLEIAQDRMKLLEQEKTHTEKSIIIQENKLNFLKEFRNFLEKKQIEKEKISINKDIQDKYNEELKNIETKLNNKLEETKNISFKLGKYITLIFIGGFLLTVLFVNKLGAIPITFTICTLSLVLAFFIIKDLLIRNKKQTISSEISILNSKKHESENNINQIQNNIKGIENAINNSEELEFKKLKEKYSMKIPTNDFESVINTSYNNINSKISEQENITNELKLKIQSINMELQNYSSQIEKMNSYNFDLENSLKQKEELLSLQKSILIAKEVLEIAYKKAKENITPNLQKQLENSASFISNGKYKKIIFNETSGLNIELENGNIIPVDLLSSGTIDQMYLALRLSTISEAVPEKTPIILDESFAFYDDTRLENTLLYLNKTYPDNQIIIFSCSNRELNILNKLNLDYNLIEMQKEG